MRTQELQHMSMKELLKRHRYFEESWWLDRTFKYQREETPILTLWPQLRSVQLWKNLRSNVNFEFKRFLSFKKIHVKNILGSKKHGSKTIILTLLTPIRHSPVKLQTPTPLNLFTIFRFSSPSCSVPLLLTDWWWRPPWWRWEKSVIYLRTNLPTYIWHE